jgi:hypothetical protein
MSWTLGGWDHAARRSEILSTNYMLILSACVFAPRWAQLPLATRGSSFGTLPRTSSALVPSGLEAYIFLCHSETHFLPSARFFANTSFLSVLRSCRPIIPASLVLVQVSSTAVNQKIDLERASSRKRSAHRQSYLNISSLDIGLWYH